ncbi:molybdopterin-dependent oxidoreductase [Roseomonas chloroacetimidivorans]|uniref:molybdopterin-dependent oxidoreductase n=1 Tax=Roseomonas chloroacetimidivorans TaxID=1766656 RepID=UPI003C761107
MTFQHLGEGGAAQATLRELAWFMEPSRHEDPEYSRRTEKTLTDLRIGKRVLMTTIGMAAAAIASRAQAQANAPTQASSLPQPSQSPILRITGKIQVTNDGDAAVFDRPMLASLGSATITTVTPWFDGPVRFEGVPMATLMKAVGATGETLTAIALNDYSTDIPIADFERFGVILATQRNGAPMRVSEKGPLFVVYPYDSDPALRTRLYYSRSAWSVAQLVIR